MSSDYGVIRVAIGSQGRQIWSGVRVVVAEDSSDGHRVNLQPVTQVSVTDQNGITSQVSMPLLQDAPIHFTGGGGVTATHPVKKGDEGFASFSSVPIDVPMQQGGVQMQIDGRSHSLSDASFHPGGRSDPRKLSQVSIVSHQTRSDDGKHLTDTHPQNGITHQSTNMIASQVGNDTAHVLTPGGIKSNAPKILLNC